jgi:predicted P-loop ATPase
MEAASSEALSKGSSNEEHITPAGRASLSGVQPREAVKFLENFHPNGPWNLVFIRKSGHVHATTVQNKPLDDLGNEIAEEQEDANCYFHVNGLRPGRQNIKATKDDIGAIVALHVDVDDPDALERIQAFEPRPTAIVFSGGGYQAFWLLKSPSEELERAEQLNEALANLLGGDRCHNIDRIMRLPGTINIPNAKKAANGRKPALARVVEADWSRRYTLDDFPADHPEPGPAGPKGAIARISTAQIVPVRIESLPKKVARFTLELIEHGEVAERPNGAAAAQYPSRSEALFRAAIDLARAGCSEEAIAGIIVNPAYKISASVIEKKNPRAYALRQARKALAVTASGWPDVDKEGRPRTTMRNALVAVQRLGLAFAADLFRQRKTLRGQALEEHQGELSDDMVLKLRGLILEQFGFDSAKYVGDAVSLLCLENPFHPILDMLAPLKWDGVPTLDRWLATCLGAEDTPLTSAIGRIMLIAAVRRVREPGVKYDTIVVLEGKQGSGKSTAVQILAGKGNHSDNDILTQDTKGQIEAMEGVWIYEIGEIAGLRRAEFEKVKAFASRAVDRARMAYGRFSEARPRQLIFVGTTNEERYLRDTTGNRRFLPVKTGFIDLEALRRDRDQLLAEAAEREAAGESITLPEELWTAAAAEQEARLEEDPWQELLAKLNGRAVGDEACAFTSEILSSTLEIPPERQTSAHAKRVAAIMLAHGWKQAKFKVAGRTLRGFSRPIRDDHVDDGAQYARAPF